MHKYIKPSFTILILFAISFSIATYFDNKRLSLPSFLSDLIHQFESYFFKEADALEGGTLERTSEELFKLTADRNTSSISASTVLAVDNRIPIELGDHSALCLDKIDTPKTKKIYSWVDSEGIRNVSDKPRVIDISTPVEVLGEFTPQTVSINFSGMDSMTAFKHKITKRVLAANSFYSKVSPKQLITPVIINIRLFNDKKHYETYKNSNSSIQLATNGFYKASKNQAVVMVSNETQGLKTSVHEAMHAMNRHWFGHMSRWLNEGVAEFAELENPAALNTSGWHSYLATHPIALAEMFSSDNQDWSDTKLRSNLYGTSWAFIAFLMNQHRDVLTKLLLQESENGCDTVSAIDVERIYGKSLTNIETDFKRWGRASFKAQGQTKIKT